jgi:hypothetical protein
LKNELLKNSSFSFNASVQNDVQKGSCIVLPTSNEQVLEAKMSNKVSALRVSVKVFSLVLILALLVGGLTSFGGGGIGGGSPQLPVGEVASFGGGGIGGGSPMGSDGEIASFGGGGIGGGSPMGPDDEIASFGGGGIGGGSPLGPDGEIASFGGGGIGGG